MLYFPFLDKRKIAAYSKLYKIEIMLKNFACRENIFYV